MYRTVIAIQCIKTDVNLNFQRIRGSFRTSMSIVNSIEASTDPEIADLFGEFFQSTYSSVSWPYTSYPNH